MEHRSRATILIASLVLVPTVLVLAVLVLAVLVPKSLHAHHSNAIYNLEEQISVEGTVTQIRWANPHVYIYLDETTDSGEVINWEIEGFGPGAMRKMGFSRNTVAMGETLTVNGNPARNPRKNAIFPETIVYAGTALFDSGKYFAENISAQKPESSTNSLAGKWTSNLNIELLPVLDGSAEQDLTEFGAAAVASWEESVMNPAISCARLTSPMTMIIPDGKRITLTDDVITFEGAYDGLVRTVHMDIASHDGATPSEQGHSIGRWEGTSLIIDTSVFANHNMGNFWGMPSGSQKQVMERLTLGEDGKSLSYHFELADPQYLASTIVGDSTWTYDPDMEFAVYDCDPVSARIFLEH
jgi:hypothetical protein